MHRGKLQSYSITSSAFASSVVARPSLGRCTKSSPINCSAEDCQSDDGGCLCYLVDCIHPRSFGAETLGCHLPLSFPCSVRLALLVGDLQPRLRLPYALAPSRRGTHLC